MKINRPSTPVVSQPQPRAQTAPAAAQPAPAKATGWAPKAGPSARQVAAALIELPFTKKTVLGGPPGKATPARQVVAEALNAGLDRGVAVAKQANDATKPATTNTAGRTETTPYKYTGALEVGLAALNRTFEGGGVDLKKAAKFLEQNAKLPDNKK